MKTIHMSWYNMNSWNSMRLFMINGVGENDPELVEKYDNDSWFVQTRGQAQKLIYSLVLRFSNIRWLHFQMRLILGLFEWVSRREKWSFFKQCVLIQAFETRFF